MGLDLAEGHASGIDGQDLSIIICPACLVFADELRFEGAQAVTGNFDGKFAEFALEAFVALAVPGIAGRVCDGRML